MQYDMTMKAKKIVEENANGQLVVVNNKENESERDPIKWFGYLPAKSLKNAQKSFSDVLEEAVHAANVLCEIRDALEEYENL